MHLFFKAVCSSVWVQVVLRGHGQTVGAGQRAQEEEEAWGGSGMLVMRGAPCRACGGNVVREACLRSWPWQGSESGASAP